MKKKISLTLDNDFQQYCDLNNIENPEKLAKQVFNKGFSLLKYGETPNGFKSEPTVVEKEVIKEVIKEVEVEKIVEKIVKVPVEVIKEVIKEVPVEVTKEVIKEVTVEVVKEVPIEIKGDTQVITKEVIKEVKVEVPVEIIKEVKVEKIVEVVKEVVNTEEIDKLIEENLKLTTELNSIKSSLDNLGKKGTLMRGSNMSSLYDE
jgi:hypothetical protein